MALSKFFELLQGQLRARLQRLFRHGLGDEPLAVETGDSSESSPVVKAVQAKVRDRSDKRITDIKKKTVTTDVA